MNFRKCAVSLSLLVSVLALNACQSKADRACNNITAHECYQLSANTQNPQDKLKVMDKACSLGEGRACQEMAIGFKEGDTYLNQAQDHDKYLLYLEKGCGLNFGQSCLDLGHETLAKDVNKSLSLYKKAVVSGSIGGYKTVIESLHHNVKEQKQPQISVKLQNIVFKHLKNCQKSPLKCTK